THGSGGGTTSMAWPAGETASRVIPASLAETVMETAVEPTDAEGWMTTYHVPGLLPGKVTVLEPLPAVAVWALGTWPFWPKNVTPSALGSPVTATCTSRPEVTLTW